jgi:polyisoprenoid-binding protein YceI
MMRGALSIAVALSLAGPALAAETYTVDTSHSEVQFKIRHLVSRVSGRFNDFAGTIQIEQGKPGASSVAFSIEAASVDTKNEKRDQHLRQEDFFWTEKYPKITFESSSIEPAGEDTYAVTGTLTMRGVSKRVTLPVRFLGAAKDPWGNEMAGFSLTTTLDRKEYGIEWNKALDQGGFLLADEVEVEINLEATKQKPRSE